MLPVSITKHPFFYENFDQNRSKEILNQPEQKANLLFYKTQANQIGLCYKASFKGEKQIRFLNLSYHPPSNTIKSTMSLFNDSTSLYDVAQKLAKFLEGFADSFVAVPLYKTSSLKIKFSEQLVSLILPQELNCDVLEKIISQVGFSEAKTLFRISKTFYLMTQSKIPQILENQEYVNAEKITQRQKIIGSIYQFLTETFKPVDEGSGHPSKKLVSEEFTISGVQQYTDCKILCNFKEKDNKQTAIFISSKSIQWVNEDRVPSDEFCQQLLAACSEENITKF